MPFKSAEQRREYARKYYSTPEQAKNFSKFEELVENRKRKMQSILPGFFTVVKWGGFERVVESKQITL